ncbi:uncharacterized protein LOC110888385 [Helianthus annuus]|uniref:uncharacterized protein LOC110888385 n=1 Tax=Helianthus annuus TaxID=4232 RepID=UPI000B8FC6A6|nr:uncharacterized protein LOC110888385 [Helianthus annuus]
MDVSKVYDVCRKICKRWSWTSNGAICDKGTRIIVGWNSDFVDLMVLSQTNQVVHTQVIYKTDNKAFFCSFIYADNDYVKRKDLWQNLLMHKGFVNNKPWVLMGDFNSSLNLEDNLFGSSRITTAIRDFKDCVEHIEVLDINRSGLHYTWNQKPKRGGRYIKEIDRVMGNSQFLVEWPAAHAVFQPYRVSDHSPCVLKLPNVAKKGPKPFKFANFLVHKPEFKEEVSKVWSSTTSGHRMYCVVTRLKLLKSPLRKLLYKQGNLHDKVVKLRMELDAAQMSIDGDPSNISLRDKEADLAKLFMEAKLDEERFLKQKSKVEWLQVGDSNSAYFHNSLKCRNHITRIDSIKDRHGVVFEGTDVPGALVDHYLQLLGVEGNILEVMDPELFHRRLCPLKAQHMVRDVSIEEIGSYVLDRIKDGLDDVMDINQSAFVLGRRISDNILLTQELMHNYHSNVGPPKCAFKVDIQKAYDTVDWSFLRSLLVGFGKRGLRQGDPMSPYFFTLVMEALTIILRDMVNKSANFKFHNLCKKQRIVNVCFADDLFMFARGDVSSARVIMEGLDKFKNMSGRVPSMAKSTVFFGNVKREDKQSILQLMPFEEGSLPVRYLGVPLISSRLVYKDYKILIERLESRIDNWKNKTLSFAGRLQLIKSVLSSMHIFWASVFTLPTSITADLEKKMRVFLWCQGPMKQGRVKVK